MALATVTPRRPGLSPNMSGSVRSLDDSWCYKKVKLGQPETSNPNRPFKQNRPKRGSRKSLNLSVTFFAIKDIKHFMVGLG